MTRNPNSPVVYKDLEEVVDSILGGMDKMIQEFRAEVKNSFESVDKKFKDVYKRFDKIDSEIVWIKHDINDIKADLSDTVSKREFNERFQS